MQPIPSFFLKIFKYFNMEQDLDSFDRIHETIVKESIFKGTNLWILVFAIIVASVGLNMNSTAVIIGAMLISPLMGPINGMGYSIATYNFELFSQSIKNLGFAVAASLVASTAYFALSPISTAHSELLARTSPTIYDVLIALFGGLAGIVAISSKQKGNVIPGVAIATALMPPLCTAGYGLASGQFHFFFGAIYLFTINTVFIAISSVVISQILKFPIRTLVDPEKRKNVNRIISTVIAIVVLPSIYFGYSLVQKEKFFENASRYISNISLVEGNYLLNSDIDIHDKTITLIYGGVNLSENQKQLISDKARDFNLKEATIEIEQGLKFEALDEKSTEVFKLRDELFRANVILDEKTAQIDSLLNQGRLGENLLYEIRSLYPEITSCSYSPTQRYVDSLETSIPSLLVIFQTSKSDTLNAKDTSKINRWVRNRLKSDEVLIIYR